MITYNRASFFDKARGSIFGGSFTSGQVSGCEAILAAFELQQPAGDPRFLADMLGTAKWETASTMQPIEEYGHGRGRAYGVPVGPWHKVYDGRGDVQLTWLANYQKADVKLKARGVLRADEDLAATPEVAMRPDVAAAIMIFGMLEGWFTGRKLADYYNAHAADWVNSRRIINGTDHAAAIGLLKKSFYVALVGARQQTSPAVGASIVIPPPAPPAEPHIGVVPAPAAAKAGIAVPPPLVAPPSPPPGLFARVENYFGRH